MANQVTLTFAGDADKLNRTIKQVESRTDKLNRNLTGAADKFASGVGRAAKGLAIVGGAGAVAVGAFGMRAIEAGEALNSIRSQTEAVVKSTAGVANVSARHVQEYSQELSNLSAVDRKVIESSQNVLLTFTNVRNEMGKGNDIFDQGAKAALNMSAALGQDLQSATTMVGKALNDPVAGISAMSEAGIQFTEQQKEQIKTMVESGDVLGAQKAILGELETQFAGSAAANADASDKIKLAMGRITEEIGLKLLPHLDKFADWVLGTGVPALESFGRWIGDEVVPRLQELGGWLGDNVVPILVTLGEWIAGTGVPKLVEFATWLGENTNVLKAVGIGITVVLLPALAAWAISAAAAAAATLLAIAPLVLVGAAVAALAYLIIENWDWIKEKTSDAWNKVKEVTTGALSTVQTKVTETFNAAKDKVSSTFNSIRTKISTTLGKATNDIRKAKNTIVSIFRQMVDAAKRVFGGITSAIVSPFTSAVSGIKSTWNRLIGGKGFSVPGWVPGVGGKEFRIPKLAKGGIIPATPGGRLVIAGEAGQDEAVVPLPPGGRGLGGSSTLVLQSSGRRVDDLLLEILRESIDNLGGDVQAVLGRG